jgi:ribonuclease J
MNCLAFECGGTAIVIDCGVTFPGRGQGVDVIHPRFDYLHTRRDALEAVVITHGHEDHIGALPYLLAELPVPVYGPPYALSLIRNRLEEAEMLDGADLRPIQAARSFGVGCLEIEPYHVNHSIPDALGLILHTPAGVVVHTGDFKIEDRPPDGRPFALPRLRELGDRGVRLLLSDSTNSDVEGRTGEEADVGDALLEHVRDADHRIVVALFASNVYRLSALFRAARALRRKVCLLGRSVQSHVRVARKLGHLPEIDSLLVAPESAKDVPRDELLVIATGTQGEPPAALARLASGTHPDLALEAGDTVLLSSRVIPGSELAVFDMMNALERRRIRVVHRRLDPAVHVSGHAYSGEQRMVLEAVRPRSFMPVHGTYHHLRRHAALAESLGVPDVGVFENGAVVELGEAGLVEVGQAPIGRVHRHRGIAVADALLRERSLMGELGVAIVAIPLGRHDDVPGMPTVELRGYTDGTDLAELREDAERYVRRALGHELRAGDGPDEIEDIARRALKRFFRGRPARAPLVVSTVVEHR